MGLYHTYRPKTLTEFLGNPEINEALITHFSQPPEKWSRAHIIEGPSGCGKTTLARIIANEFLGASNLTFTEINTADNRGIDTVRDIIEQYKHKPLGGKYQIFLIDEAHGLTKDAKRALLKPLEDAPSHVFFFLCTTNVTELLKGDEGKAIGTRCTKWMVQKQSESLLTRLVRRVAKAEGIEIPGDVLEILVHEANGSPRDALVALEQVSLVKTPEAMISLLKSGILEDPDTRELCQALLSGSWSKISTVLAKLKAASIDPESIRRAVQGYMVAILLKKDDGNVAHILESMSVNTYDTGFAGIVSNCYIASHP